MASGVLGLAAGMGIAFGAGHGKKITASPLPKTKPTTIPAASPKDYTRYSM